MHLLPSTIHSIYAVECPQHDCENKQKPKLQVFAKDGCFFALDHNALKFYQELESQGRCDKVIVDLVPKKNIPVFLWHAAFCDASEQPDIDKEDDSDSDSVDIEESYTPGDDFACIVCGLPFQSVKDLTEHQTSKKHYGCLVCGESFQSIKVLQQHENQTQHGFENDDD